MIVYGTRSLKISQLQLPGDMRERMKTVNANDLGADLQKFGRYIHDPLVRQRDMRLISGRDRVAGAMRAGIESLEVKLCDCSDDEAEELELVENLKRRRDDEALLRKRHMELLARKAAADMMADNAQKPSGGQPTAKGAARKELARKLGVRPESLRRQEARQEAKRAEEEAAGPAWGEEEPVAPPPPPIELLGADPSDAMLAAVCEVQGLIDEADKLTRALQAVITKLKDGALALPEGRRQRLHKAAHALANDLRGSRPVMVCPFCKLVPELQQACTGCATNGYIVEDQRGGVPAELLKPGLVAANGRFVSPDKIPGKKRLRASIVDEDGNEAALEPEGQ